MNYITSYINPDTDGITCMLAMERFMNHKSTHINSPSSGEGVDANAVSRRGSGKYRAVAFGNIDFTSRFVLNKLNIPLPDVIKQIPDDAEKIILVDTHSTAQLPAGFPTDKVVAVYDHHPDGDIIPNSPPVGMIKSTSESSSRNLQSKAEQISGADFLYLSNFNNM